MGVIAVKEEEWRPVAGHEGMYDVSDQGRVRSVERRCKTSRGHRAVPARIMSPQLTHNGYRRVPLRKGGSSRQFAVHRLVLEAFCGPCPEGMQCRHLNGDGEDNRLENLKWGTPLENARDRDLHGATCRGGRHWTKAFPEKVKEVSSRIARNPARGSCHRMSKLTEVDVQDIRRIYGDGRDATGRRATQTSIAEAYGVSLKLIHNIVNHKTWRHVL